MPFGSRELRAFCRPPMGVPVRFAGVERYEDGSLICGLFDRTSQTALMEGGTGGAMNNRSELQLPFNAFDPMPKHRDTLNVDGTDYTVHGPPAMPDGGGFLIYDLQRLA